MDKKPVSPLFSKRGPFDLESIISASILFVLIIIAVLIFFQQFRYDEKEFNASVMQAGGGSMAAEVLSGGVDSFEMDGLEPEGFMPMSDREYFDRATLSDKIDGKADTYLEAGFLQLFARRFVSRSDPANWFEFYLYDMEIPRNAFSVYSKQKRDDVTDQDYTEFAYSTQNALFFAHGRYYVEIIAALEGQSVIRDMIKMSQNFISRYPGSAVDLPELAYLPLRNLDPGSISLILKDGFGCEGFNNIFTGTYKLEGSKVLAFVSLRGSIKEAESLAATYDNFISEFVGTERIKPDTDQIPGIKIADIFDEYEIYFTKGNVIAGIHSVSDRKAGERLAVDLYKKISEMVK